MNDKFEPVIAVVCGMFGYTCRVQGKAVRGCVSKPEFMVFGDDGKPKLSRLDSVVCKKHLPKAVRKCHEYNKKTYPSPHPHAKGMKT